MTPKSFPSVHIAAVETGLVRSDLFGSVLIFWKLGGLTD